MPQSTPTALLTSVREGKLFFADGSAYSIPHFGDPDYLILYAVRHTEKGRDTSGQDNPDLLPEGYARAERLGKIFDQTRLDKIGTINLRRTIATGYTVNQYAGDVPTEAFAAAGQDTWLEELLRHDRGKQVLYVGQVNTVPALLNRLTGEQRFANIPDDDFGKIYVAVTKGIGATEVLELRY